MNNKADAVVRAVCTRHHVTLDDLRGPCRAAWIVDARYEAMRELRALGLSLPRIGALLNRHHTTVLHGLRQATS